LKIIFNKRIVAAILAIAIASSLIAISDFVGYASAYAAKKVKDHKYGMTLPVPSSGLTAAIDKDKSISRTSHGLNADDSGWTIGDANSVPTKEMYVWRRICNT
jgi:hypothetical protein